MSAGAAAAAEAERRRQEEEEMTKYTDADLQGIGSSKSFDPIWPVLGTRKSCNRSVPRKLGQAGLLWRSSIINVCDSSVPLPHGRAMWD